MSPSNPENDPVHKGLHALGRQIEEGDDADAGAAAGGAPGDADAVQ